MYRLSLPNTFSEIGIMTIELEKAFNFIRECSERTFIMNGGRLLLFILIVSFSFTTNAQSDTTGYSVAISKPMILAYSYLGNLPADTVHELKGELKLIEWKFDSITNREVAVCLLSIENRTLKQAYILAPYYWGRKYSVSPHEVYYDRVQCEEKLAVSTFRNYNVAHRMVDVTIHLEPMEKFDVIIGINQEPRSDLFSEELNCLQSSNLKEFRFLMNVEYWLLNEQLPPDKWNVLDVKELQTCEFELDG